MAKLKLLVECITNFIIQDAIWHKSYHDESVPGSQSRQRWLCKRHKDTKKSTRNFSWFHLVIMVSFFSATSIKSQVCEVVQVIQRSLYQIHTLFCCDDEDEQMELKGQFFPTIGFMHHGHKIMFGVRDNLCEFLFSVLKVVSKSRYLKMLICKWLTQNKSYNFFPDNPALVFKTLANVMKRDSSPNSDEEG